MSDTPYWYSSTPKVLAEQPAPEAGTWYAAKEIDAMVRDLDIAMNGDGAAPQAKLCDLMSTLIKRLTEQPAQQEPVAKVCHDLEGHIGWNPKLKHLPDEGTPLYTSPPAQRTWVGLTDVQIGQVLDDPNIAEAHQGHWRVLPFAFARAIEAKLKELNT